MKSHLPFKIFSIIVLLSMNIFATVIDVKDYGAEVNDEIDDYYAIQRAIASLDQTKSGTLIFHKGIYNINHHKVDNNTAVQKTASLVYKSKPHDTKSKKTSQVIYLNEVSDKIKYKSTDTIRSNFTFSNYTSLTVEGNGAIFNFDGDWTRTADYNYLTPIILTQDIML